MKKEFTLRLDDAACAELENLKKLSGEKTDAKAIRFAIQNYAVMNQERTLTFGKYKGTHRSNITGGFSAGDFGGLIYSIENFNESEYEF